MNEVLQVKSPAQYYLRDKLNYIFFKKYGYGSTPKGTN